jgi:tetratricopeptide (TPR) repeat protein
VYDENFAQNIYLPFLRAEDGWQGMLDEAGVNVLLMRYSGARFDQRITRAAFEDPRWKLVYWDDIAMILVRDTPANAEVIGTDPFRVVNPDSPDPGLLVASGMGEAAQAEILRVVTRDPACRRAWNMLGDLRLYMGRFAESEEAYRRLEALAAHKHERALAIAGRARAGLAVGRAADALALCDRALVMSPRDMSIKTLRAQALLATGRAEEAKREARELARSKGTASADLISLAQTLVVTGDHELAGSLFATAAAHAGDGVDRGRVLFATATTWEQAGALPLAEDAYRRAMAADPANPEAVKGLAWLLGRQGRNAEALELARRAVTLGSNDGAAWGTLGLAMLTAGHPDSAVVAFERSRELLAVYAANPGYRQALGNTLLGLAWAYEATGHPVQSARALAEARELGITTEGAGHTGPAAGPPDGAPGKSGY